MLIRSEKLKDQMQAGVVGVEEQPGPDAITSEAKMFLVPTTGELGRLILTPLVITDSDQPSINCFAGLLNQGSPEE